MTNFRSCTPIHRLLCSKPPQKYKLLLLKLFTTVHWPHFCPWQLKPTFIQSRMVSSQSHTIHARTSSVRSAKSTLRWIGRSRSFKVILIGVSKNLERATVVMYNNVQIISETFHDIALGKRLIRRFQTPHSGLTRVTSRTLSNI